MHLANRMELDHPCFQCALPGSVSAFEHSSNPVRFERLFVNTDIGVLLM
jgi:hypothetical protein